MAVTLTASESLYIKKDSPTTTFTGTSAILSYSTYDKALIKFAAPSATYEYRRPTLLTIHAYCGNNSSVSAYISGGACNAWSASTTYKTFKAYGSQSTRSSSALTSGSNGWLTINITNEVQMAYIMRNGAYTNFTTLTSGIVGYPLNGSTIGLVGNANAPYVDVTFSANSTYLSISSVSPVTNSYIPKTKANTFTWGTSQTGYSYASPTITSSKLRWKTSGSGTVTEIDCGTDLSYTFAANTFSTPYVIWQAEVTDSTGYTSTSEWQTLTTTENISNATAISPKNTMVDGSKSITFTWEHTITTGTDPTGAQLQKSQDGTTWTTFETVSGSDLSVDVAANTFTSGTWYWRVRTSNTDNTYGNWSDPVAFLVVAAPTKPKVSTDGNARPTVSWQGSDQQGFRVLIDDIFDSGVVYGTASSYLVPMYLPDGSYTVSVGIVNGYGLWSEYGVSPLNVSASSLGTVTLTATSGSDVVLTWTATSYSDEKFIVYRDGTAIAITTDTTYTDSMTAGEHTYTVRQYRTSDNNATSLSNEATATSHSELIIMVDVETGNQIVLQYSSTQYNDEVDTNNAQVNLFHFCGAEFPEPELSAFADRSMTFRTAFMDLSAAAQFEEFYKKTVCIKTPKDNSIIGVFAGYSKTESRFYVGYDFTISQINWSEVIDL